MPEWAQGLAVFAVVMAAVWLTCCFVTDEWLFLPKRSHDLPYRQVTRGDFQGQCYEPQPRERHRCSNEEEGIRGTIWICTCGRPYINRDSGHSLASGLYTSRRYWWRLRWWFPWSWRHLLIVRQLRSNKYHLIGREGV